RADASLEAGLRAAAAGYSGRLERAANRARRLATDPSVQQAMRRGDQAALRSLVPVRPKGPAAVETVSVVGDGRVLGRVSVYVPIDAKLLASLDAGLVPGGTTYRGLLTTGLSDPPGLELAALTRQSGIDSAAHAAEKRILAALAASLLLFALVTYLLGRSVVGTLRRLANAADSLAGGSLSERVEVRGNDEFAQLGRAFNRMASQLEQRLGELEQERLRVQEAVARFGEALAATHDVGQLIRVVVESAVEAIGAAGGLVLGPDGELARAGDPDAGAERIALPLRVGSSDFGLLVLTGDGFDPGQVEAATSLS